MNITQVQVHPEYPAAVSVTYDDGTKDDYLRYDNGVMFPGQILNGTDPASGMQVSFFAPRSAKAGDVQVPVILKVAQAAGIAA